MVDFASPSDTWIFLMNHRSIIWNVSSVIKRRRPRNKRKRNAADALIFFYHWPSRGLNGSCKIPRPDHLRDYKPARKSLCNTTERRVKSRKQRDLESFRNVVVVSEAKFPFARRGRLRTGRKVLLRAAKCSRGACVARYNCTVFILNKFAEDKVLF